MKLWFFDPNDNDCEFGGRANEEEFWCSTHDKPHSPKGYIG